MVPAWLYVYGFLPCQSSPRPYVMLVVRCFFYMSQWLSVELPCSTTNLQLWDPPADSIGWDVVIMHSRVFCRVWGKQRRGVIKCNLVYSCFMYFYVTVITCNYTWSDLCFWSQTCSCLELIFFHQEIQKVEEEHRKHFAWETCSKFIRWVAPQMYIRVPSLDYV